MNKAEFEKTDIFGVGAPNDGFAQYFVGNSFLKPLTEPGKCPVFLANVTFEPGVKHWHGSTKDSWFSHIAVECPGVECNNEWCEPVSEEEYGKLK